MSKFVTFEAVYKVGGIAIAIVAAAVTAQMQIDANAAEIGDMLNANAVHSVQHDIMDGRTRELEIGEAATAERIQNVQADIGEIRRGQEQTNDLLRELISKVAETNARNEH